MTQSGEQLTLKGEFKKANENVFSFHKSVGVSYSMDIDSRNQVDVKMFIPSSAPKSLYQMIFVLKGKIVFKTNGLRSHMTSIKSQQHNLCHFVPLTDHMVLSEPSDEVICINLSYDFLQRYLPASHAAWQQLSTSLTTKGPALLSSINMHLTPEISAILQRLDQTSHSGFCDQLLLESKVIELLALQISQFETFQAAELPLALKKEEMDRMLEAREILINHTGDQLSLRTLAHLVGTNEFNLKRNFKIAFGNTVYGYLNQYKMEQAKTMLVEKDLTIAEVSLKMGYKYATHFSTAFKKYFGYLPNRIKSGKLSLLLFIEDFSIAFENFSFLLD